VGVGRGGEGGEWLEKGVGGGGKRETKGALTDRENGWERESE